MQFISYEFIGFTIILLLSYYLLPKKYQWLILLVGSYIFYSFAGLKCLAFIIFTSLSVYFTALHIGDLITKQKTYLAQNKDSLTEEEKKNFKAKIKKQKNNTMLLGLLLNLGVLAILKYTNFVTSNINVVLTWFDVSNLKMLNLILPLGISYYTFQALGYLLDVNRGNYPPINNLGKFMLYVSFFPQLIQGPISRFNELAPSLFAEHEFDAKIFLTGLRRTVWGYFKVVVIANRLLPAVKILISQTDKYNGVIVLIGMILYAITLYANFTGGIDIAIGIAKMLDIELAENFKQPFLSTNIEEYWRRWHITMGTWFRDYIFYPMSVCKPMLHFAKKCRDKLGDGFGKRLPVYVSTIVVWFATGIWHGASWNFVVWGLLNGFVIIISQELSPCYAWFHSKVNVKDTKTWYIFSVVRTFLLMCFLRAFDCYASVPETFKMVLSIFTKPNFSLLTSATFLNLGISGIEYLLIFICVVLMFVISVYSKDHDIHGLLNERPVLSCVLLEVLVIFILVFGAYGKGFNAAGFIYSQF